ncbi:MAG: TRAP transporter substrate-binding protein [Rhodospirillales bacterium]|jgi:TRAP-type C4-dicarboxylate transport system substrate-binding protein|nr:TRAP transporter substrate-binding protein [Rhodospirillales bacterium]
MRKSWIAGIVGGALIGVGALAGSAAAQTVKLKLGHVDNAQSHSGVGVDAFAAEVAKLSNGTMKIEVFHSGKLGNIPAEIANTFSGSQDIHLIYPEFLASFAPEANVISLPYLFNSLEHLQKFYQSDLWKPAVDAIEKNGAVLLDKGWSWFIHDPRGFNATRPVFTPAELKGLKMRIWEAKAAIETWKGFGSNPVVVPRPEMYLAFKQKIIEGGPETAGVWVDQKNAEMAKYWMRTEEYYQIINMMVNKKKYASLTAQQQGILQQAMTNAGKAFRDYSSQNFELKKRIARTKYGGHVIEPALGPWREAGKATIATLEADGFIPKGFVAKIRALDK